MRAEPTIGRRERGASGAEYAILVLLTAVLGLAAWTLFGEELRRQVLGARDRLASMGEGGGGARTGDVVGTGVLVLRWGDGDAAKTVLARGTEAECRFALRLIEEAERMFPEAPREVIPRPVALLGDGTFFEARARPIGGEMARLARALRRHAGAGRRADVDGLLGRYEGAFERAR